MNDPQSIFSRSPRRILFTDLWRCVHQNPNTAQNQPAHPVNRSPPQDPAAAANLAPASGTQVADLRAPAPQTTDQPERHRAHRDHDQDYE